MDLSKRLEVIASFVDKNTIVADIGTDHGYIPIYLIENKISKKVIAGDVSGPSLHKARENVEEAGLEDKIKTRLGDGLDVFQEFEVDTVIMAGMGGILMTEILDKDRRKRDSVTNYILQPNLASDKLREYLFENGFSILDEKLVLDGDKYYEVLKVKKGLRYKREAYFYKIGHKLIENKDPLLPDFIRSKIDLNQSVLEELKTKEGENIDLRRSFLQEENQRYQEVLDRIEG